MAQQSNASPFVLACALAALSCLLLWMALPQMSVAWLTAPANLDHTQPVVLNPALRDRYVAALDILPQSQIYYAIADYALHQPFPTTMERESAIEMLQLAAARTPGDTHVWYLLAAALETETFDADRRALWDRALSMSLLTGPYARDLIGPRTLQITEHWDIASPELKDLWQEQIINFWGAAPNDIWHLYRTLPAASQKILADTLGEVPQWDNE